jgi:hypothetical protein
VNVYVESGKKLGKLVVSGVDGLVETAVAIVVCRDCETGPPYLNVLPVVVYVISYCLIRAVGLVTTLFVESE